MTYFKMNDELQFSILRSMRVGALTAGYILGGVGVIADVLTGLLVFHTKNGRQHWSTNEDDEIISPSMKFELDWKENSLPPITTITFYLGALIGAIIGAICGIIIGMMALISKPVETKFKFQNRNVPNQNIDRFVSTNYFFSEHIPPISDNKTLSQMGVL